MPRQEQIEHEQRLLTMYRSLLKEYLRQQAMWEELEVPQFLRIEIPLIRHHIMNLKGSLRASKILIVDYFDDDGSKDNIIDEITHQRILLEVHRENLAFHLKQQQQFDMRQVPVPLINSIRQSRSEIQRIKAILRGWSAPVDDLPAEE